jgi:hypothetical protein
MREPPKKSYAQQSGVNYADEAPNKITRRDAAYIDTVLKQKFIRGHAMKVHVNQMNLVRGNARANTGFRRKKP